MKKALLLLAFVVSVFGLAGQTLKRHSLTINSNIGVGNVVNNSNVDGSYTFQPEHAGFTHKGAILWGYHFNTKYSLHTGLGWAQYSAKGEAAPFALQNFRMWHIEIPVAFRLRKSIKDWGLYLQPGVAYSYNLTSKVVSPGVTGYGPDVMIDMFQPDVYHNIAANISAGVEYAITTRTQVFMGAEYRRLLISYKGFYSSHRYLWSAGINIGCRVHLGK